MRVENGANPKPRKGRARKILKWTAVVVLAILVLVIVAVPMVVSSRGFRTFVLSKINDSVGGRTDFSDLSMGWIKGVKVTDLSFDDDAGLISVKVKQIATKPHYASLFGGNLSFGRTTIERPEIEIRLKDTPPGVEAPAAQAEPVPVETVAIALVTDIVIIDGSVKVTDAQSRTAELSKINSNIGLRLPGEESTFDLDMVLVAKGKESKIHTDAKLTPRKAKGDGGWTLEGATGELTIEISELDLESLEPFLALSGAEISTKGLISVDIKGQVKDGRLAEVVGKVRGSDIDITVEELKGDRIQTKSLDADIKLTQKDKMISIDILTLKTDWAELNVTGSVPTNLNSLDSLLAADSTAELKGSFSCDLAAIASQMPNTLGLKEGTKITSGRILGEVQTVAQGGKKQIRGSADIVELKGVVDGKAVALSEPVKAQVLISKDKAGMTFDELKVSSSFAKVDCTGTTEKLKFSAGVDLAKFQSELGQFVDLGGYRMSGFIAQTGEVAISEERIVVTGSGQIKNLEITSPNNVTVSEPKAELYFAVDVDRKQEIVTIRSVKANATFGQLNVVDAVIPFGEKPAKSMDLTVKAANIDLGKLRPFAVMFGSFPEDLQMSGVAESEIAVTSKDGIYKILTDRSVVKNFSLSSPGKKPFVQSEISLVADLELNTAAKIYTIKKFNLVGDQIKVSFAPARLTTEDGTTTLVGKADLEYDWAAVGRAASGYLPEGFVAQGKRTTSIKFASQYPADDAGKLMANLSTSKCTFGFDKIDYRGLSIGVTDVNAQFDKGLLTIDPFTTVANEGEINFGANVDFRGASPVISIPQPISMKGIRINEKLSREFKGLLAIFNPIFKDTLGVGGTFNFSADKLMMPLAPERKNDIQMAGSLSMDNVNFTATGLLGQILGPLGLGGKSSVATVHPTRFTVKDGWLSYDDAMQMDILRYPVYFRGGVGLDGRVDMKVELPLGDDLKMLGIGEGTITGTIDDPKISFAKKPEKIIENVLKGLLEKEGLDKKLFDGLFKR